MRTSLGKYLDRLKANKTKIADISDLKRQRVSDLSNKESTKPTPLECYKVITAVILLKNYPEEEFDNAIDEIFPDRPKADFLIEFSNLSRETQFIRRHFLTQKVIEEKIGMSDGKISRLGSKDVKEVLAVELICFIEGLGLNVLKTFKEIYGTIDETESIFLPNPEILNERTDKIYQYIEAYNQFDVPNMVVNMSDTIIFLNMENNKSTMRLEGADEFKKQAIEAVSYFTQRQQTILSMTHKWNSTEITVDYHAIAAMDFPNGIKKGDQVKLKGKSIFEFSQDGEIVKLTDIS